MSKVVTAKYDAAANALRLAEPFDELEDHEEVDVTVAKRTHGGAESWRPFVGCLAGEAGDDFARVLEEMFPIER
jgi:hypothetical protein